MAKRPGKYDHVLDELPKSYGEEPSRQAKINEVKTRIKEDAENNPIEAELTGPNLVRMYSATRDKHDQQAAILYDIALERDALEQLMAERFAKDEMSRVVLDSGEAVSVGYEPRAKVINAEEFRLWCVANGYENKLQLMWATTNSIVKERLLAGEDDPDGVVAEGVLKVRFSR